MQTKAERNRKKANFNRKKMKRYLGYIEERAHKYLAELAKNDVQNNSITIIKIAEKIERLKKNKLRYKLLE
jgi:hypothetical protein